MSKIEWTDTTWNPVVGCTPVSPGCLNCYAATMSHRLEAMGQQPYVGLTVKRDGRQVFNGTVRTMPDRLIAPLSWRKPRRVFVNSMSDLFHEDVPFEFVDRVFAVMALTPQHTYQILTKRPERMAEYLHGGSAGRGGRYGYAIFELAKSRSGNDGEAFGIECATPFPLPNVWLGTSVENQATANERIPHLLKCPAAVRFLSCEPLLGHITLSTGDLLTGFPRHITTQGHAVGAPLGIHWVIVGGESGHNARPIHIEHIRSIVQQCQSAGVPVFVKQLGANCRDRNDAGFMGDPGDSWDVDPIHDVELHPDGIIEEYQGAPVRVRLRDRKGGDPSEWPEDLRVREWPKAATGGAQ